MTHRYMSAAAAPPSIPAAGRVAGLPPVGVTPIVGPVRGVPRIAVGDDVGVAPVGAGARVRRERGQEAGCPESRHEECATPLLYFFDVCVRQLDLGIHGPPELG